MNRIILKCSTLFTVVTGIALCAVLLSGCVKEELDDKTRPDDGMMTIQLSLFDMDVVQTRALTTLDIERFIGHAIVLLFDDTTGKCRAARYVVSGAIDVNGGILYNGSGIPTIRCYVKPKAGDHVVVLCNTGNSFSESDWIGQEESNINSQIGSSNWMKIGTVMPMYGRIASYAVGPANVCVMTRASTKIQLNVNVPADADATGGQFTKKTVSFQMGNVLNAQSDAGHIVPPESGISYDKLQVWKSDNPTQRYFPIDKDNSTTKDNQSYYGIEYSNNTERLNAPNPGTISETAWDARRTYMLVVCNGKYYRIDFYDYGTKKYIDFVRNTNIIVNITKVKSIGYDTPEEAATQPGSNLEYTISVIDPNSNVVESNGQYALSLSNDEVIVYGGQGVYTLADVQYIANTANVGSLPSTTTVTASGNGMTLVGTPSISATSTPIKVTLAASFTTGTLTFQLGNITKAVKVTRFPPIDAHGSVTPLTGNYIGNAQWISNSNNAFSVKTTDGVKKLYTVENVTPTNAVEVAANTTVEPTFAARSGEMIVPRLDPTSGKPGATRIIINQTVPWYIGWFGGDGEDSSPPDYTHRLIMENAAEAWSIEYKATSNTANDASMVNNRNFGRPMTVAFGKLSEETRKEYPAFNDCYMKNDLDGNGVIDSYEQVNWYLPALNQSTAIYEANTGNKFNIPDHTHSWTASESDSSTAWCVDLVSGNTYNITKMQKVYVRCVRNL